MRRRVKPGPAPSAVFGTTKGAPRAFKAPEGTLHEQWAAWEAWSGALERFKASHPELAEACDEVRWESCTEIPDEPWDIAVQRI